MSDDPDALAKERTALHVGQASRRPLSHDYERKGIAGEREFARVFNLPMHQLHHFGGDDGIDYRITLRFSVDVKCAGDASRLLVEEGTVNADIYVLAEYDYFNKTATLVGWTWASVVRRVTPKDTGRGIINHYVDRDVLRPMSELLSRYGK
jgi:hypothetical protein